MSEEATGQISQALVPAAERPGNGMVVDPNYAADYSGIAAAPYPEEVQAVLREPIDPDEVEIKPDGIVFLPGVWWRRRLLRAFGAGGWAVRPAGPPRIQGTTVVCPVSLYCLGRYQGTAYGECGYVASNPNMSYASALEGARTDGIERCAKDLGIASELWDPVWREQWIAKYATKAWDPKARKGQGGWRWSRKDGRQPKEADLASGAGGSVPDASEPSNTSPAQKTDSADAATPASHSEPGGAMNDTGEAAPPEAYDSLMATFKRLKFNKGGVRHFIKGNFGFGEPTDDPEKLIKGLTAAQCDTASALLGAWGDKVKYPAVVAELKKSGALKQNAGPVNG